MLALAKFSSLFIRTTRARASDILEKVERARRTLDQRQPA
jgi:hypothetical protein